MGAFHAFTLAKIIQNVLKRLIYGIRTIERKHNMAPRAQPRSWEDI